MKMNIPPYTQQAFRELVVRDFGFDPENHKPDVDNWGQNLDRYCEGYSKFFVKICSNPTLSEPEKVHLLNYSLKYLTDFAGKRGYRFKELTAMLWQWNPDEPIETQNHE